MGEIYRPMDLIGGTKKPSDFSPRLKEITPKTLQDVIGEIRLQKIEIEKIKQVLRVNSILVE